VRLSASIKPAPKPKPALEPWMSVGNRKETTIGDEPSP
jgi:hypothetical protein